MIFDRISLVSIYDTLKIVDDNDGPVSEILLNRTANYGTKTIKRFKNIAELKSFIEEMYPFSIWDPECTCGTCNEGIYHILAFKVYLTNEKHAIFVNNMRQDFESAKGTQLNGISVKKLSELFKLNNLLAQLKEDYTCFPYIRVPGEYTDPCDYIEIIKNKSYEDLILLYNSTTKKSYLPKTILNMPCGPEN